MLFNHFQSNDRASKVWLESELIWSSYVKDGLFSFAHKQVCPLRQWFIVILYTSDFLVCTMSVCHMDAMYSNLANYDITS